jgi:hypothetical protein
MSEAAQVCGQLEAAFDHTERLILVMCTSCISNPNTFSGPGKTPDRSLNGVRAFYNFFGCFHTLRLFGTPPPKNCKQMIFPWKSPIMPWDGLKLSHARCAPGFKSQSSQSHLSSFRTSSWAGFVLGFWWFPLYELHVYSSMWSEAEALSEYGVVPEQLYASVGVPLRSLPPLGNVTCPNR